MLSFKDFMTVDYTPGMPELVSYAAYKRHRGRIGEDTELDEVLNVKQRRDRARQMKKHKAKIAIGRKRAAKKAANKDVILRRAVKQARTSLFKKFSKGASKADLPVARKAEIEKRLNRPGVKARIQRIARKSLPSVRKMDRDRRSGRGKSEKG